MTEIQIAWTDATQPHYERGHDRYAIVCADEKWVIIEPLIPILSRITLPRKSNLREVWNVVQFIATTGCQWALLAKCFPAFKTVLYCFYLLLDSGVLDLLTKPSFTSRVGFAVEMKNRRPYH